MSSPFATEVTRSARLSHLAVQRASGSTNVNQDLARLAVRGGAPATTAARRRSGTEGDAFLHPAGRRGAIRRDRRRERGADQGAPSWSAGPGGGRPFRSFRVEDVCAALGGE